MSGRAPRVVSLLPSATEIAVALGLSENLVGRSHECDYPTLVERLPICTSTKLEKGLNSREIDDRVQEIVRQGLSVYRVDTELLRALAPDVILTQSQCAVCAVTPADLDEALNDWVGTAPIMVSLAPDDLSDVWKTFQAVGDATGTHSRADEVVSALQARMGEVRARRRWPDAAPTIAAIEWMSPLMIAGNWVPELIRYAGGTPLLSEPGEHSDWLKWSDLVAADPDIIVLMPCGYQIDQAIADVAVLEQRSEWGELRAVRAGCVVIADGHHYFNRPGPRLPASSEILAALADCIVSGKLTNGHGYRWLQCKA